MRRLVDLSRNNEPGSKINKQMEVESVVPGIESLKRSKTESRALGMHFPVGNWTIKCNKKTVAHRSKGNYLICKIQSVSYLNSRGYGVWLE